MEEEEEGVVGEGEEEQEQQLEHRQGSLEHHLHTLTGGKDLGKVQHIVCVAFSVHATNLVPNCIHNTCTYSLPLYIYIF